MNRDTKYLFELCLRIADNNLITGQRICEWCGHGPFLEEDIALSNIGLDMLGQANYFYQYAVTLEDKGRSVDELALLREEKEYKNDLIAELPNGDYAFTMLKLYFFSEFQQLLYKLLSNASDETICAMADKAIKETTYHVRHCKQWVLRFGNGTLESKRRLKKALHELWPYTQELFDQSSEEKEELQPFGIAPIQEIQPLWHKAVVETIEQKHVKELENVYQQKGRMESKHTEYMGYILTELQYMQRTYPNCVW